MAYEGILIWFDPADAQGQEYADRSERDHLDPARGVYRFSTDDFRGFFRDP